MSVSAIFGCLVPVGVPLIGGGRSNSGRLVVVCSGRPRKKATAHHVKTRPRKTQPWDINRKPPVRKPLPPMPPDWTLVSAAADNVDEAPPTEEEEEDPPTE